MDDELKKWQEFFDKHINVKKSLKRYVPKVEIRPNISPMSEMRGFFKAHATDKTKIIGCWAEDLNEYDIIVPPQLRDIFLYILKNSDRVSSWKGSPNDEIFINGVDVPDDRMP